MFKTPPKTNFGKTFAGINEFKAPCTSGNKIKTPSKDAEGDEGTSTCEICNSSLNKKNRDYITCKVCGNYNHVGCIGMSNDLFNGLKNNSKNVFWVCERCENQNFTIEKDVSNLTKIINDGNSAIMELINQQSTMLASLKNDIDKVRADTMIEVNTLSEAMNNRINALDEKISSQTNSVENINAVKASIVQDLNQHSGKIFNEINDDVSFLYNKSLLNEKLSRNSSVVITGIHDKAITSLESVKRICSVIKVPIEENDIDDIYPVHSKDNKPRLIVKFARALKKKEVMKGIKAKKSIYINELGFNYDTQGNTQVFLNEHLSWKNQQLWAEAKKLRAQGVLKYVWINNGDVLYRCEEGAKAEVLKGFDQLNSYKKGE